MIQTVSTNREADHHHSDKSNDPPEVHRERNARAVFCEYNEYPDRDD